MNVALLAVIVLTRGVETAPPPKGPDLTRLCIENATDGLVGAWLRYRGYPFSSRVIKPATTYCTTIDGYSQMVQLAVGKGEREIPGLVPIFPDRVDSQVGAECPSNIEGGQLRFTVTKLGDKYQCADAR